MIAPVTPGIESWVRRGQISDSWCRRLATDNQARWRVVALTPALLGSPHSGPGSALPPLSAPVVARHDLPTQMTRSASAERSSRDVVGAAEARDLGPGARDLTPGEGEKQRGLRPTRYVPWWGMLSRRRMPSAGSDCTILKSFRVSASPACSAARAYPRRPVVSSGHRTIRPTSYG